MTNSKLRNALRFTTAVFVAPVMAATGFRFGKEYRWGVTRWHRAVYAMVGTVQANIIADEWARPIF